MITEVHASKLLFRLLTLDVIPIDSIEELVNELDLNFAHSQNKCHNSSKLSNVRVFFFFKNIKEVFSFFDKNVTDQAFDGFCLLFLK